MEITSVSMNSPVDINQIRVICYFLRASVRLAKNIKMSFKIRWWWWIKPLSSSRCQFYIYWKYISVWVDRSSVLSQENKKQKRLFKKKIWAVIKMLGKMLWLPAICLPPLFWSCILETKIRSIQLSSTKIKVNFLSRPKIPVTHTDSWLERHFGSSSSSLR